VVSATLRVSHKAIGAEVRRAAYAIELDGTPVGSVAMNDTFETALEPGSHTVQIREGRKSSKVTTFDVADGEVVAFRATGKRFVLLFLASFVVPSLALVLVRE
jgi:hypothetical protein